MNTTEELKQIVKEKYGEIADQSKGQNETSCCGSGCGCATIDEAIMAEDYSKVSGYVADADLGLGCGLPTQFAKIKEGDVVIDLGSGAGNDAFVARAVTGATGKVIGVDFTERMIDKARANAEKLGYQNVEFRFGDIEKLPVSANVADVVVSNCVMNLVPDKRKAFAETFRVIKPGGHFSISDIVLVGNLPDGLRKNAEMYAGCISGAIQKDEYIQIIKEAGFSNIEIQKNKKITLPHEILASYLNEQELTRVKNEELGIFSITVYAEKHLAPKPSSTEAKAACCGEGSTCC
ncbi:MAG TPA: arsenite methyltransferase [Cyclobacteriaceae bacterium]|nr:arsenite methyltransferase [Cyclobacteriaceae bacterium]HPW63946.1 arsenite methyltransferase [Cyclobacteriaceae bacterium]